MFGGSADVQQLRTLFSRSGPSSWVRELAQPSRIMISRLPRPGVFAERSCLADHNAIGIGLDLDRSADGAMSRPSTCCCRTGRGRSSKPRPASRGTRQTDPRSAPAAGVPSQRLARSCSRPTRDAGATWRKRRSGGAARRLAPHSSPPAVGARKALAHNPNLVFDLAFSQPEAGVQAVGSTK
jgi:hypothetical protein